MIASYEIWVSDNPIGVDPQASSGAYMAAKGDWVYAAAWSTADFTASPPLGNGGLSPHARYIQVRSYADGNGSGSFEICGSETRVNIWGSFDGNVNVSYLVDACAEAMFRLTALSKASTYYPALEEALEDADALLSQADEANDPASGKSENEKLAIQAAVDDAAAEIFRLVKESAPK
jgi:hypothetical protein